MIEVVVKVVVSFVSIGKLELGSDGVVFIIKVFGGRLNVLPLVVRLW